jgi:hypothetical protein
MFTRGADIEQKKLLYTGQELEGQQFPKEDDLEPR